MVFVLAGFQQKENLRHYRFEGILDDRTRVDYVVIADLGLLRKYQIGLQEAPLLCLHLLQTEGESSESRHLTFSEDGMRKYANDRAAAKEAAALKAKKHRYIPKPNSSTHHA